ncbi:hypothetical protein IAD21_04416 [Abditibacteriota bacterium]|nr:hypothetical protein IAD21_04416 [Abditibacteriota bacterium]
MANEVNFDALVQRTMTLDATPQDLTALNDLYGQAFALPNWHFIARGQFPDVSPYIASNEAVADGQYMIRSFTDPERLQRFVKENHLEDDEGGSMMINIPTENIIDYLEQFIAQGVHGIWFNSDTVSDGFFVPLKQLRPIKEYLERIHWKQP